MNFYDESDKKATLAGYTKVNDEKAFRGYFFKKNNKIWIHNLVGLWQELDPDSYNAYLASIGKKALPQEIEEQCERILTRELCTQIITKLLKDNRYNVSDYMKYANLTVDETVRLIFSRIRKEKLLKLLKEMDSKELAKIYASYSDGKPLYLQEGIYLLAEGELMIDGEIFKTENDENELLAFFENTSGDGKMYLYDGVYLTEDGELIDTKNKEY